MTGWRGAPRGAKKQNLSKRTAALWGAIGEGAPLTDVPQQRTSTGERGHPERDVQREVVVALRRLLPANALVFSVPNHGFSDNHRFVLLQTGMVAGVPDLIVIARGRTFGIECKSAVGRLSDRQREVHATLEANGVPVCVARSGADAVEFLQTQGAI